MHTTVLALFAVLVISFGYIAPAYATGLMDCDTGESQWRSMDELREHVIQAGWQVRKVKVDDGCYEIYGTTPEGQRVEAYFDPVTFEKLLVARRGEILFKKEQSEE